MGFRLVPKLVTLNDLGIMALFCIISPTSVVFRAHYVEVVEDTPIHSGRKM